MKTVVLNTLDNHDSLLMRHITKPSPSGGFLFIMSHDVYVMSNVFGSIDINFRLMYNTDINEIFASNYIYMNKAALAQAIADKAGLHKKEAELMVEAFVSIVTTTLQAGDSVNIAGFGAFSAKTRAGRIGVNPQNPSQKIQIPPVTVPKFKAGKGLKDALKGKKDTPAAPAQTEATPEAPTAM